MAPAVDLTRSAPRAPTALAGFIRAGFDENFPPGRIVEADVPGLTTVVPDRVAWRQVPRPIWPLDPLMTWAP